MVREVLQAILRAHSLAFSEDDIHRLALELLDFVADGRRMVEAVPSAVEPIPVVAVED